jgi:glucosylceramidase
MNDVRGAYWGIGWAILAAGCGSDPAATPSTSSGGSAVTTGGSTSQSAQGGATQSGGTSGAAQSGGSTTNPSGGSTAPQGGSAPSAGTGGVPTGTGGVAAGGASGGTSGLGGSGGSTQNTGGAATAGGAGAPAAGAGAGGVAPAEPQVVTSANNAFWQMGTLTAVTGGTADVTVSTSGTQTWYGFGGTFNEAGWDALSVLPAEQQQLAIKLLYDAVDGANFAYGRVPIGASDYAMSRYTFSNMSGDYTMTNFSIARDQEKLIPYIKAALAVKPGISFWASPWTPPAWLKTNNSTDAISGKTPPYADSDGVMKSDDMSLTAYAIYLEKFVQEYAKAGITIRAIHPQNEPGYGNPYPSCYWPSALFIKFIRDFLGPKFKTDLPTTEIWGGTMSAPGDGDIAVALSNDAAAMQYVKGFGLQWNTRDKIATLKGKNLPIMQTEHKCGNYDFTTDYWNQSQYDSNKPQNDFAYGVESWKNIRDWVKAGVNAYSAWNMVLDTAGANLNTTKPWHQNALLTVDRTAKTLIKTPAYYVFRHLSQYVDPMSTVVGASGGDALAFKNPDGTYVVVIYNEGAAKKMTVSIAGTNVQFDMPGNGWATVNYKK